MFRFIEQSSGQIKNILLVQSVSAHYGIPYYLQNCIDIKVQFCKQYEIP